MNYRETLIYLERLEQIGIKLGLENINRLLLLSGRPERKLRFVHIAGTNGKGSTAAFMAEILKYAGYRVGLYTSPHLNRFEERIVINGTSIGPRRLASLATYYKCLIEKERSFSPTYFEVSTAMAIKYFSEEDVDICIMETGLGGRLDATNIIKPEVCIITSISQDHMQFLGYRLSDIAREKFSIIKPGADVVAYLKEALLKRELKRICRRYKNLLILVDEDIEYNIVERSLVRQVFTLQIDGRDVFFKLRLLGDHQVINACLAFGGINILSSKGVNVNLQHIRKGLENTYWPGRFEIINRRPYIVLDGAHNTEAIKRLRDTLRVYFPDRELVLILGVMADKDWRSIIKELTPGARMVLACDIESKRACPAEVIARESRRFNMDVNAFGSVKEAIDMAMEKAGDNDIICITGSLYLVGEARKIFK